MNAKAWNSTINTICSTDAHCLRLLGIGVMRDKPGSFQCKMKRKGEYHSAPRGLSVLSLRKLMKSIVKDLEEQVMYIIYSLTWKKMIIVRRGRDKETTEQTAEENMPGTLCYVVEQQCPK